MKLKTGADVRTAGSGNIGATNVMRTSGRGAGILTLLLDIAKGYAAVWIAGRLTQGDVLWMSVAAVTVMLGHAYPVFLGFDIVGGILWGAGVTLLGYFLGNVPFVKHNLEFMILLIVFLSILPGIISVGRALLERRRSAGEVAPVEE